MNNKNNWQRLPVNDCECGCGAKVAKTYKKGHGRRRPLRERLMSRVERDGKCWIWTGALDPGGYGRIGVDNNRTDMTHRVAYRLFIGPIPEGLHIDHLCRERRCCNPSHLEPVTQAENNRRAYAAKESA